jgi:hypothetical protein
LLKTQPCDKLICIFIVLVILIIIVIIILAAVGIDEEGQYINRDVVNTDFVSVFNDGPLRMACSFLMLSGLIGLLFNF